MFGTAIGDALGWPVEFLSMDSIFQKYGIQGITDIDTGARYTDDTQMMRAALDGLIRARPTGEQHLERAAEEVAEDFIAWSQSPENNRAPGASCMHGCRQLANDVPWREAGKEDSKGCGTAMRSMAYGAWFLDHMRHAAQFAAEHALMTHRHDEAQAAAAAVAAGTSAALQGYAPEEVCLAMRDYASLYDVNTSLLIGNAMGAARSPEIQPAQILDMWRGWTGAEAVAASVYCYLKNIRDWDTAFRYAVVMAANSPGDSDSLGAITGALTGATVGCSRIPRGWLLRIEKSNELGLYADRIVHARMEAFGGMRW